MADVFISYARSTEDQAQQIAKALRDMGYNVWRDDDLPAHRDYTTVIEEHLHAAKAVVVAWSAEAVKSRWVCAEADVAHEAGVLIQLTLDGSTPPLPFNRIQCADMNGWMGEEAAPGWQKVVRSVVALVGPVAEAAPPTPTVAPAPTGVAARWATIAGSLDADDYADFLHVFPQSEEAFEARRQKRRLDAWAAIDQTSLPAVLAFLRGGAFPALLAEVQAVAEELAATRLAQPPAAATPAPAAEVQREPTLLLELPAAAAPAPEPAAAPSEPIAQAEPTLQAEPAVHAEPALTSPPVVPAEAAAQLAPVAQAEPAQPAPPEAVVAAPPLAATIEPEPEPRVEAQPEAMAPAPAPDAAAIAAHLPEPEPRPPAPPSELAAPEPARLAAAAAPPIAEALVAEARVGEPSPPTAASSPPPTRQPPRPAPPTTRSPPWLAIGGGVALVAVLAVGGVLVMQGGGAHPARPTAPSQPGPTAPPAGPGAPPTAAPAALSPIAQDAGALVADARRLGRPGSEVAALSAASSSLQTLATQAQAAPAASRPALLTQLDTAARGMAGTEAATLSRNAEAQAHEADRTLADAPAAAHALQSLHAALSNLSAAAGAVSHASDGDAAIGAARQALTAYAAFASAEQAVTPLFATAKRAEFTQVSDEAHALARQVIALASAPKPWLFAATAKKQAYQLLQTNAATAKAQLATLDSLAASAASASGSDLDNDIGQATRAKQALGDLLSSSTAAAAAAK